MILLERKLVEHRKGKQGNLKKKGKLFSSPFTLLLQAIVFLWYSCKVTIKLSFDLTSTFWRIGISTNYRLVPRICMPPVCWIRPSWVHSTMIFFCLRFGLCFKIIVEGGGYQKLGIFFSFLKWCNKEQQSLLKLNKYLMCLHFSYQTDLFQCNS